MSRAKRGSRNRGKRKAEFAREWQRVREREHGALHELTAAIVRDHSANLAVEDLRIPNMVRNRRLARVIHEQQWGAIVRMLGYKAESAGGSVTTVAPHHTTRECSSVRTPQGHHPGGPRLPLHRLRTGPGPGREHGKERAPKGNVPEFARGSPGTRGAPTESGCGTVRECVEPCRVQTAV